jgi:hypothetical protein
MTSRRGKRWLRDHGLSIALIAVFAGTLVGHAWTGFRATQDDEREDFGRVLTTSFGDYVRGGNFCETLFENWESEFLQMVVYVGFTAFLFHRGAADSKDPDGGAEPVDEDPRKHRRDARAPWPVRRGGWVLRVYEHSLSIALTLLFLASMGLHVWGGRRSHSLERARHGLPPLSAGAYFGSSQFWFESFQNWQSEFFGIVLLVVASVYLRQRGSPESKPVHSPHSKTGKG